MKRRILLVDDEVAVLLTLKAVLEISGFDVDTATSAREAKSRLRHREYEMVITDMRMEDERAGEEVIQVAKAAPYRPAIALLTAFPMDEDAISGMGADKMLVKPMHTRQLLQQLEALYVKHHGSLDKVAAAEDASAPTTASAERAASKNTSSSASKPVAKKTVATRATAAGKSGSTAPAAKKAAAKKKPATV